MSILKDTCKTPCLSLSVLWAEWASLILPQVRQPLLCQPAPLLPSTCTTPTSKPCQHLQVVSTRQSLTGNPALQFQNVSPKGHTGTELPLPPAATPSVLWHRKLCRSWTGNCKGLLLPFMPGSSQRSTMHSLKPGIKIRPHCKCEKSHFTVIYAVGNMFWLQIDWIGGPTLNL